MLVGGSKCAMASEGDCQGRLEWHHAVKQQRLRREFKYGARWDGHVWKAANRLAPASPFECVPTVELDDILGDTRNRVWLCSYHHELVTNGLDAQLENDLARAA